uniref:EB domain-containing protein n=1 Tax=Syphacia muris TaxID=451379 RepID=A0A0N5AHW5_9BILA
MNYCVFWQNNMCVYYNGNCSANQVYFNGICYDVATIGQRCIIEQQCQGGSSCISNYCQCPTGSRCTSPGGTVCNANQVNINGFCYNTVYVGYACQYTQQCLGGSTCTNGYCQCANGYTQDGINLYVNGYCYNYANIGESCQVSQQCQGGSTCNGRYCQCPTGNMCLTIDASARNCSGNQVLVNGVCYTYAVIGQSCQVTQQCRGNSACSNGICQCPSGTAIYNYVCINNGNGRCSSNQVYVNNQCFNLAQIGEMCYYNDQCLGYSQCTSNYCRCPDNMSVVSGYCESVTSTANCASYQINVNGQCLNQVTIGMECSSTLQCIGLVALNQVCTETAQCMGHGSCINQLCQCTNGQSDVNGLCL